MGKINVPSSSLSDEQAMRFAIELASQAAINNEVPVGAVVLKDKKIIGYGMNQTICQTNPTAHAEMIALQMAAKTIGNYRLVNCELFVTLEPCLMCLGAIFHSRVARVHFATHDHKTGACGGFINLCEPAKKINHHCQFDFGIMAEESKNLLQNFFAERRRKNVLANPYVK